jgi:hypothetical protein
MICDNKTGSNKLTDNAEFSVVSNVFASVLPDLNPIVNAIPLFFALGVQVSILCYLLFN